MPAFCGLKIIVSLINGATSRLHRLYSKGGMPISKKSTASAYPRFVRLIGSLSEEGSSPKADFIFVVFFLGGIENRLHPVSENPTLAREGSYSLELGNFVTNQSRESPS